MKIRTGFVSNSSSTSFTIRIRRENIPDELDLPLMIAEATGEEFHGVKPENIDSEIGSLEWKIEEQPDTKGAVEVLLSALKSVRDNTDLAAVYEAMHRYNEKEKTLPMYFLSMDAVEYWDDGIENMITQLEDYLSKYNGRLEKMKEELRKYQAMVDGDGTVFTVRMDHHYNKGLDKVLDGLAERDMVEILDKVMT